ncbi:hypothetical protein BKA80DRAFT_88835 [Phyllosticta citrichinensis]
MDRQCLFFHDKSSFLSYAFNKQQFLVAISLLLSTSTCVQSHSFSRVVQFLPTPLIACDEHCFRRFAIHFGRIDQHTRSFLCCRHMVFRYSGKAKGVKRLLLKPYVCLIQCPIANDKPYHALRPRLNKRVKTSSTFCPLILSTDIRALISCCQNCLTDRRASPIARYSYAYAAISRASAAAATTSRLPRGPRAKQPRQNLICQSQRHPLQANR